MLVSDVTKNFVKEFYIVNYDPHRGIISICDDNEGNLCNTPESIFLGKFKSKNVILGWGNIKEITGIEYHHKDYVSDLTALFSEIYRNKLTREFFETLIEENVNVTFTLKEMINYFPTLE
jgi:hypothetical protein